MTSKEIQSLNKMYKQVENTLNLNSDRLQLEMINREDLTRYEDNYEATLFGTNIAVRKYEYNFTDKLSLIKKLTITIRIEFNDKKTLERNIIVDIDKDTYILDPAKGGIELTARVLHAASEEPSDYTDKSFVKEYKDDLNEAIKKLKAKALKASKSSKHSITTHKTLKPIITKAKTNINKLKELKAKIVVTIDKERLAGNIKEASKQKLKVINNKIDRERKKIGQFKKTKKVGRVKKKVYKDNAYSKQTTTFCNKKLNLMTKGYTNLVNLPHKTAELQTTVQSLVDQGKVWVELKNLNNTKLLITDNLETYKQILTSTLAKKPKPFFGVLGKKTWAVQINNLPDGNTFPKLSFGRQMDNFKVLGKFKETAKRTSIGSKGKPTLASVKKWVKEFEPKEFFATWNSDSSQYKDDSVEIYYKK